MTWSIIARDTATGCYGIAVATKFFAVGSRVPHVASRIGAVATQALVNPFYGPKGLALLRGGARAADVVKTLVTEDAGRDHQPEPLQELERLERVSRERFVPFRKFLPSRSNPFGETDREVIEAGLAALAAETRQ